jgi:propionyl-CoA synthetase
MEAIVASHPAVAECAVIGVQDPDKGQVPVGLVILKDNSERAFSEIQKDLVQQVRKEIGAFANFKLVMQVDRLPKTRSGKILRKTLRQIADGLAVEAPPTIDDPNILGEIAAGFVIEGIGEIGRQSHE